MKATRPAGGMSPGRGETRLPGETHHLEPFDVAVDALTVEETVARVIRWARTSKRGRYVCLANVHMLVEGMRRRRMATALRDADLVLPDGMPLVWLLSAHVRNPTRVAGMDLLPALCRAAEADGVPVFFWGSSDRVLRAARERLERECPRLRIGGMKEAPHGRVPRAERREVVAGIRASGAGLVFVALGCPRQEIWMRRNRDALGVVLVGIGGALDVFAGLRSRAPRAMQRAGLEWLHRLVQEPSRMWRRYLDTNTAFAWRLIRHRLSRP